MSSKLRSALLGIALLLPSLVFLVMFTAWPVAQTILNSFYRRNLATRNQPVWDGFGNYVRLFAADSDFWHVLSNTLFAVAFVVPVSVILAFLFALLLNQRLRGIGWLRSSIFYPTILPMVSAASIWLLMFNVDFGLVNSAVKLFGGKAQNFLGTTNWALWAVCFVIIWKMTGFLMVFYLAGLQGMPTDVMEAARLDGAGAWQTLWHITLPLLRGTTVFVITVAVTSAFQTVDHLYVMTQGGPNNASNLLLFNLYETNFRFQDSGLAYAQTVVLLVLLLIFTIANTIIADRRSYDAQ